MVRKVFKRDKRSLRSVNGMDSWGKSLLDNTSETFTTWMIVLEQRQNMLRVFVTRDHQDSELIGWIRGHTRIDPVHQIRVMCSLDQYGIEVQVLSTWRNRSCSWIVISRGQTVTWMYLGMTEVTLPKTLRWWVSSTSFEQHTQQHQALRKLMRRNHRNNRVWWITLHPVLPAIMSTSILLIGKSRKDWQHSYDIEKLILEKLTEQFIGVLCFRSYGVISNVKVLQPSQILNGWVIFTEEGPRFQCWGDSNNKLLDVRAIQGHSGGELVAPELLNHVAIPLRWKEYLCHVGSSLTVNSILQAGPITGGKDTKEERRTVFFTPSGPFCDDTEEAYDDSTKPRKVHYKNKWKIFQDAVYWVIFEKKHKIKDYNSGRPGLMPASFMTQCQLTALKKW